MMGSLLIPQPLRQEEGPGNHSAAESDSEAAEPAMATQRGQLVQDHTSSGRARTRGSPDLRGARARVRVWWAQTPPPPGDQGTRQALSPGHSLTAPTRNVVLCWNTRPATALRFHQQRSGVWSRESSGFRHNSRLPARLPGKLRPGKPPAPGRARACSVFEPPSRFRPRGSLPSPGHAESRLQQRDPGTPGGTEADPGAPGLSLLQRGVSWWECCP